MQARSKTSHQYLKEGFTDEQLVKLASDAVLKQITIRSNKVWQNAIIAWLIAVTLIFLNFSLNPYIDFFRLSDLALLDSGFWVILFSLVVIPGSVIAGTGYRFIKRNVVYYADPIAYDLAESKGLMTYYRYPIIGFMFGSLQVLAALVLWNVPILFNLLY